MSFRRHFAIAAFGGFIPSAVFGHTLQRAAIQALCIGLVIAGVIEGFDRMSRRRASKGAGTHGGNQT